MTLFNHGDKATAAALLDEYNEKYPDMQPVKSNAPIKPDKVFFHRIQDHNTVKSVRAKKEALKAAFKEQDDEDEPEPTPASD